MSWDPNPGPSAPRPGPSTPTPPGGPKLLARIAEPIRVICAAVATRTAYAVIVATVETVKRSGPGTQAPR